MNNELIQLELQKWHNAYGDATHRVDYPLKQDSLVLDLGGHKGDWCYNIWSKYSCNVLVFEPIPFLADIIRHRFADTDKVQVYPYGLSDEDKELRINYASEGSSFYTNFGADVIDCQVKSITSFLKENSIDQVDLVKINIEGDEYPVLESLLDTDLINVFDNIQVQFHTFIPNAEELRNQIQQRLSKTHHLTYNYHFVCENWKKN